MTPLQDSAGVTAGLNVNSALMQDFLLKLIFMSCSSFCLFCRVDSGRLCCKLTTECVMCGHGSVQYQTDTHWK